MNTLFSVILIIFGLIAILKPLLILKLLYLWPMLIKKITGQNFPSESEDALNLIRNDKDGYVSKFGYLLTIIRVTGFMSMLFGIMLMLALLKTN